MNEFTWSAAHTNCPLLVFQCYWGILEKMGLHTVAGSSFSGQSVSYLRGWWEERLLAKDHTGMRVAQSDHRWVLIWLVTPLIWPPTLPPVTHQQTWARCTCLCAGWGSVWVQCFTESFGMQWDYSICLTHRIYGKAMPVSLFPSYSCSPPICCLLELPLFSFDIMEVLTTHGPSEGQ